MEPLTFLLVELRVNNKDKAMQKKWVLVSDVHRIRIFEVDETSNVLIELDNFFNSHNKLAEYIFSTNMRSHLSSKAKQTPSNMMASVTTLYKPSDALFCKQIARYLEQQMDKHTYDEISIVAASTYLNMLSKKNLKNSLPH